MTNDYPTTNTIDPYPTPTSFPADWGPDCDEEWLLGSPVCLCEQGWQPLLSGEFTQCEACREVVVHLDEKRHRLITSETCPCDKFSDRQCNVRDGGLAICADCGKAEIELDEPCDKDAVIPLEDDNAVE